jgi:hypothetical protein
MFQLKSEFCYEYSKMETVLSNMKCCVMSITESS